MLCPICERDFPEDGLIPVKVGNEEYRLCEFDLFKVSRFIDGSIKGSTVNILWGAGRIDWCSWAWIRDFLHAEGISEVLEFGAGLSSELFLVSGFDLISCDILPEHIFTLQKHQGYKQATFIAYPDPQTLPDIEALYPGRQWDFVFVDGPQERSREVRLAMKLSRKYIYLHDPNAGEQTFFPNEEWVPVGGDEAKLFRKAIPQHHQQMLAVLRERFGDRPIKGIEIGTAHGCLTKAILGQLPNVQYLITIDPWRHDPKSEYEAHLPPDQQKARKADAYRCLAVFGDRVEIKPMASDEAAQGLLSGQFDFVWIDGDHSGPQVARDLANYDPLVKPGGLIGGHDYKPGTPLADAIKAKYGPGAIQRGGDWTWWVYK